MGKLHTLKRAIIRNPKIWINHTNIYDKYVVNSAIFFKGQWYPFSERQFPYYERKINRKSSDDPYSPYRRYIAKVLRSLGYDSVG